MPSGTESCRRVPRSCKRAWQKENHWRGNILCSDVWSICSDGQMYANHEMTWTFSGVLISFSYVLIWYIVVSYLLHMRILKDIWDTYENFCVIWEHMRKIWEFNSFCVYCSKLAICESVWGPFITYSFCFWYGAQKVNACHEGVEQGWQKKSRKSWRSQLMSPQLTLRARSWRGHPVLWKAHNLPRLLIWH